MNRDVEHMRHAIRLAQEAEQTGNLPIGAVITLDDEVVAEGMNSIWVPVFSPSRHAEIETLDAVPPELWERRREMTLYTTLEPCLMCMSTILVHRMGRVVFGSNDPQGGASYVFGHMSPSFERYSRLWSGLVRYCSESATNSMREPTPFWRSAGTAFERVSIRQASRMSQVSWGGG